MLSNIFLSIGICGEAEHRLRKKDPSEVVLDEFVAVPFCFLGLREFLLTDKAWVVFLVGFGLFRCFDIVKPLGIRKLQYLYSGLGVVVDDIAAALATCVCLNILVALCFS